jgi:hypothetical protein
MLACRTARTQRVFNAAALLFTITSKNTSRYERNTSTHWGCQVRGPTPPSNSHGPGDTKREHNLSPASKCAHKVTGLVTYGIFKRPIAVAATQSVGHFVGHFCGLCEHRWEKRKIA